MPPPRKVRTTFLLPSLGAGAVGGSTTTTTTTNASSRTTATPSNPPPSYSFTFTTNLTPSTFLRAEEIKSWVSVGTKLLASSSSSNREGAFAAKEGRDSVTSPVNSTSIKPKAHVVGGSRTNTLPFSVKSDRSPQHKLAGHTPRPPNAFILFRNDLIARKAVPTSSEADHSTISKIIGVCWRTLPPRQRRRWEQRALEIRKTGFKNPSEHFTWKQTRLVGLAGPYKRRFDRENRTLDQPTQSYGLAKLHNRRFYRRNRRNIDLSSDIESQKARLERLSAKSPQKPIQLLELANLYKQRFDREDQILDLDNAIAHQKAGLELLSYHSSQKPIQLFELVKLYKRHFARTKHIVDLDNAITNQQAALKLLPNASIQKRTQLFELARLYKERFDQGWDVFIGFSNLFRDINDAIASQEEALKLLPDGDPGRLEQLCELILMRTRLTEAAKGRLLQDLQQLSEYIKKPELGIDMNDLMGEVTSLLNDDYAKKICSDIRGHSIRLSTYCEALKSQVSRGIDRNELLALYKKVLATERKISAAHNDLTQRYEKTYMLWRAKREHVSKMLSQLDSVTSRGYIEGVRSQVQQVDEGFEEIRRMLDNQRHALRDYFDAQKIPIAPAKRKSDPLSEPVPPDNSGSVRSLSDSLTNSPNLPRAIEAGKEALSQVRAVVGKARYTKARKTIEDKLSTTTSQLEKLYCVSQEYALKVQGLSTPQSALQTKWWNRWCGPSHQLLNLVKTMINRLMEVQRGFDKYKRSILGLIFRPLGDMIEDLKPYCSQVGQEVITKELHADMILYEAAFLFLLKSWSKPLGLAEQIDECKSRLEATVYRV